MNDYLARKWAEQVDPRYPASALEEAARDYILANTKPETMADVEWDVEKHYLAGAYLNTTNRDAIMLGTWDDQIVTVDIPRESDRSSIPLISMVTRNGVTPNGKRYRLVEDTEQEHPETLHTLEDYKDAPPGTVVAGKHCIPYMKSEDNTWFNKFVSGYADGEMAGLERCVLRWGW